MEMQPAALMVHVTDWQAGFAWYRRAFPGAEAVELAGGAFKALRIGDFTLEIVWSDAKVPSGKAGTACTGRSLILLTRLRTLSSWDLNYTGAQCPSNTDWECAR